MVHTLEDLATATHTVADVDAEELSAHVATLTALVSSAMVTTHLRTVALVVKAVVAVLEALVVRVVLVVPALAAQDQILTLVREDLALVPAALDLVQDLAMALLLVGMVDTILPLSPRLVQLLSV